MSTVARRVSLAPVTIFGAALVLLWISQWWLDWAPRALSQIQRDAIYRVVTGVLLAAFIAAQWLLAWLRSTGRLARASAHLSTHRWIGASLPAVVLVHTGKIGFGYLALLTLAVFSLCIMGITHPQHLGLRPDRRLTRTWTRAWLPVHIVLSVLVASLIVLHIGVVTIYH